MPALFLSSEFDPTVPPHLSAVAAEQLTHAYLYTFLGMGHSLLGSSSCAQAMMLAFLDDPAQAPHALCLEGMPGLALRLPMAEVDPEPFTDEDRGFSGPVPAGWQARAPAYLVRGGSVAEPACSVLEAQPGTAAELFGGLAGQLGLDSEHEPTSGRTILIVRLLPGSGPLDPSPAEARWGMVLSLVQLHSIGHDSNSTAVDTDWCACYNGYSIAHSTTQSLAVL